MNQSSQPTNTNGVTVRITAIDPNGNFQDFGTATSDASGTFIFSVTPSMTPVEGTYKITATFSGSNSNYPSYAESGFTVNSVPTVTPTATAQANVVTTSDLMTYLTVGVTAIIIAIAIVGLLLLRKHP